MEKDEAQVLSKRAMLGLAMIVVLTWPQTAAMVRAESLVLGHSGTGISGTLRRVIEK